LGDTTLKKQICKVLSIILVGTTLLGACSKKEEEKKVLVMGTSADYAPFEYVDTANGEKIVGIDVEIAENIAEELGYELKIKDMDFNSLIPALKSDKIDFAIAGMNATEKRKKTVDFTDTYYVASNFIMSHEGHITKLEDLKGKTVGVQLGSVQEEYAKELEKEYGIKIEARNRVSDAVQELKAERVDAVIIEDSVSTGYLEKNSDLKGFKIEGDTAEGYAIALKKNSELTKEFNEALKNLEESGELKQIFEKYFNK
jgi:polar amino acid transport system substrate-binding protein